jgi:hypothetical protein
MSSRAMLGSLVAALVGAALGAAITVTLLAKPGPACDTDMLRADVASMRAELVALRVKLAEAPQAPAPPPAASRVTLMMRSDPSGADVVDDAGRLLGNTPLTITVPGSSAPRAFTLRRAGYQAMTFEVTPEKDTSYSFSLVKRAPDVKPNPYKPAPPGGDLVENPFDTPRPKR